MFRRMAGVWRVFGRGWLGGSRGLEAAVRQGPWGRGAGSRKPEAGARAGGQAAPTAAPAARGARATAVGEVVRLPVRWRRGSWFDVAGRAVSPAERLRPKPEAPGIRGGSSRRLSTRFRGLAAARHRRRKICRLVVGQASSSGLRAGQKRQAVRQAKVGILSSPHAVRHPIGDFSGERWTESGALRCSSSRGPNCVDGAPGRPSAGARRTHGLG